MPLLLLLALPLLLTALVAARIVYGLWSLWRDEAPQPVQADMVAALGGSPTAVLAGLLIGYYLGYQLGLRWRLRGIAPLSRD